ncbi:MAG: L,D-transpeptidase family protein [Luteimonas sp.]
MPRLHRCASRAALLLTALLLAACSTTPTPGAAPLTGAQQLVVVTAADWNAAQARMQRFERDGDGAWRAVGDAVPVMLGRSGSGWGIGLHPAQTGEPQKREGDGRAPAGVFAIGEAFGYAPTGIGALPYLPMQASHYCIDVPTSPLYNRIVDEKDVGAAAVEGSSERMRLDLHNDGDVRYRQGFVIEHNAQGEAGRGSCIFAHLLRRPDETTAGCTAMSDAAMEALLGWLDPARTPRFVLLPDAEYARLQTAWQLPALPR